MRHKKIVIVVKKFSVAFIVTLVVSYCHANQLST